MSIIATCVKCHFGMNAGRAFPFCSNPACLGTVPECELCPNPAQLGSAGYKLWCGEDCKQKMLEDSLPESKTPVIFSVPASLRCRRTMPVGPFYGPCVKAAEVDAAGTNTGYCSDICRQKAESI